MSCSPIIFSFDNHVEDATLTSVPTTITNLDFLKNEIRARQAKWNNFTTDEVVITGVLPEQRYAEYFAIPGSNLQIGSQVKLELFETDVSTTDIYQQDFYTIEEAVPLGIWKVGIDPYGNTDNDSLGDDLIVWFDQGITYQKFKVTIKHAYPITTPVSNGIIQQDSAGLVSVEAEDCYRGPSSSGSHYFNELTDALASGGKYMKKDSLAFHWSHINDGPTLELNFTASKSGLHTIWIRCKIVTVGGTDDGDSIYCVFDGHNVVKWFAPDSEDVWEWKEVRDITLVDGVVHSVVIAARDYKFTIDKIVIKPSGESSPTSTGPVSSGFGTTDSENNVCLRMIMLGSKLQMQKNFSYGITARFLTEPNLTQTFSGFYVAAHAQKKAKAVVLNLDQMTDTDKLSLVELEIKLSGKPFLVSIFPDKSNWVKRRYSFLARLADTNSYTDVFEGIHETTLTLVEV